MARKFGYETKGASSWNIGKFFACRYVCPDAGILNSISVYLFNDSGSTQKIQLGIYNDVSGTLGIRLISTISVSIPAAFDNWRTIILPAFLNLGSVYWLTIQLENSAAIVYIYYDAGDEDQQAYKEDWDFGTWPDDPAGLSYSANKISIYATYTPVPYSPYTWGIISKNQIDPERVEAAIARIIAEHNDDEQAHVGEGRSLDQHKVSVIIDHVVASIIADKIAAGEIERSHLSDDAVILGTENFDKGAVMDFTNFSSAVSGSAIIVKQHRNCRVKTGSTVNSVAQVYTEFDQQGDLWYPTSDLELQIHYYIDGDWGWETAFGTEIYIKYGEGINADMGSATDKCFGIKLEDNAEGEIVATAFVRDGAVLKTEVMQSDLQMETSYVFRITKIGSIWKFYINGVLKASITEAISGAVGHPYLSHVAKNPVAGGWGESLITQISYFFPY